MKTMILAAAFAAFAGAASAELIGSVEYAVEAETVDATAGFAFDLDERVTFTPVANFAGTTDVMDIEFTGADLGASWKLDDMSTLYGNVELDADMEYVETTVGVSFSF